MLQVIRSFYSIFYRKWRYLRHFISGVPFDSKKDLGKDLRDVHTVVPGQERKREEVKNHTHNLWLYI